MARSVGKQLYEARTARGLCIEDVQHKTRIPCARLQELENDDYANFANLTYAKGFLNLYSKYLKLDISEYLAEFQTGGLSSAKGYAYLQAVTENLASAPRPHSGESPRRAYSLAVVLMLLAIPIIGAVVYAKMGEKKDQGTVSAIGQAAMPGSQDDKSAFQHDGSTAPPVASGPRAKPLVKASAEVPAARPEPVKPVVTSEVRRPIDDTQPEPRVAKPLPVESN